MQISTAALAWAIAMTAMTGAAQAQGNTPLPSTPAAPQPSAQPADPTSDEGDLEEVVVTGQRPYGSTVSDIKPEQQLSPADIRSYGVSSVAELLTELAPQTNAAAGPPVTLLNGKRISGFQEIRDIPTEAIQRVEILPEDVALSYGYAANQKVVNIVLRRRFNAWTGEVQAGATTEGGRENGKATANLLRIQRERRLNLDVTYGRAASLRERQRDIDPTTPAQPYSLTGNLTAATGAASPEIDAALSALAGRTVTLAAVPVGAADGRPALSAFVPGANAASVSDLGRYRTLSPATENVAINATYALPLSDTVSASFNGRVEFSGTDSLQGLPALSLGLPAGSPFSPFARATQLYRYTDATGALEQRGRTSNVHLGATANGQAGKDWNWTLTGGYDRVLTRTANERGIDVTGLQAAINAGDPAVNPFGVPPAQLLGTRLTDTARSLSSTLNADFLLSGPLFRLPAGRATSSITVSGTTSDFSSRSLRAGVPNALSLSRDIAGVKANIDLPIASKRRGVLGGLGELALNANGEATYVSDFGRLTTFGYGLRWTPIPAVRLIASRSVDQAAPSGQQVNNPLIVTPNVPVFDYRTGQTVFVSQVGGGNAGLLASERHRFRLSLTVKPISDKDLTLTALYNDNRTDNPVGSFPVPTPQIEAAFPGRFQRDAGGRLLQIDSRPVNFAESRSRSLRYGFNFSVPVKSALQKKIEAWRAGGAKPEERPAELDAMREMFQRDRERRQQQRGQGEQGGAAPDGAPPPAAGEPGEGRPRGEGGGFGGREGGFGGRPGGGFGGPGGGFGGGGFGGGGRGGAGGGGRMQFALFHTWHLKETIEIAPGVPVLDLLDGAAIGGSGGQSKHEVEAQAGYTNNGLGFRLSGNWQSPTRVDGALGTPTSTLNFGSLTTLDLRVFANFGQMPELVRDHPFLRGSRLTLSFTNLFDAKRDVRDGTGTVPLSYQPDRLDPLGRRVMIGFRKVFF